MYAIKKYWRYYNNDLHTSARSITSLDGICLIIVLQVSVSDGS